MKKILLAAAALSMLAAPAAFAQDGNIAITGEVDGQCGFGAQSGGGTGGVSSVDLGDLVDADGFLDVAETTLDFGNVWCNAAADLELSATALSTSEVLTDAGSFSNSFDMVVGGQVVDTYFGQGAGATARTGADLVGATAGAFETGTGIYSKAKLNVVHSAGDTGNDRPIAGTYNGTVTLTASVS